MGGMKTGAGEDPFADDADAEAEEESSQAGGETGGPVFEEETREESRRTRDREPDPPSGGGGKVEAGELPFIARRNARGDNVKAGRETRRLFELRPEVAGKESAFMDDLESELGTEVPKTDAREAALAVVYERPELVAERLEDWGITYFKEE